MLKDSQKAERIRKSIAFTLAEVLITLGIIGIVAAMTMPTLIANGKKQETSARLKKFNSMMQQAILLSENDNGPKEYWSKAGNTVTENGTYDAVTGSVVANNYFKKYLLPYIKYLKYEENKGDNCSTGPYIVFTDGSTACIKNGSCIDFSFDTNGKRKPNKNGYDKFYYIFCNPTVINRIFGTKKRSAFFPWYESMRANNWNNRDYLMQQCKNNQSGACARLIEFDGWEIKDDYPW